MPIVVGRAVGGVVVGRVSIRVGRRVLRGTSNPQ